MKITHYSITDHHGQDYEATLHLRFKKDNFYYNSHHSENGLIRDFIIYQIQSLYNLNDFELTDSIMDLIQNDNSKSIQLSIKMNSNKLLALICQKN